MLLSLDVLHCSEGRESMATTVSSELESLIGGMQQTIKYAHRNA